MLAGGAVAAPAEVEASTFGWGYPGFKKIKYLFSFGDSYTQTGFNMTNGSPLPTVGNPMGNPTRRRWTAANGPIWVGYLTIKYNASTLLTCNMAYGGATIVSALVAPWRSDVLDQIERLFIPILGDKPDFAPWKSRNSLFSIWIGINDIAISYWNGDFDNFHTILMDAYFGLVEKVQRYLLTGNHSTAALRQPRPQFRFHQCPTHRPFPLIVGQGEQAITLEKEALSSYNSKLTSSVKEFANTHKGVWSYLFDSSALYIAILDNPLPYGLKNATDGCKLYEGYVPLKLVIPGTSEWDTHYPECGEPVDEYFWYNSLHPGYKANDAMAKELGKRLK
ncbi:hypothetical protein BDZ91DRAFT_770487 [Kalaharituber pfeilii]|nr:hypothetical protein BDZ91DRAFT_770487 [Kalaharituber pfeilii]